MNRFATVCIATAVVGVLASSGCRLLRDDSGLFVDSRDDYLDAEIGKPLVVPESLDAGVGDTWPIPEIAEQPGAKTYPVDVPRPKFLAGRNVDAIRIQKLGTRSWIVLGDAPEQVWPLIKQFMVDADVGIEREDPPAGIVESAWFRSDSPASDTLRTAVRDGLAKREQTVPPPDNGPWLDRVLLRIERGIRLGSSEVHVVHMRRDAAGEAPAVAEVEAELTAKLADFIAQGAAAASVSMIAREIASESKARIVQDETGMPRLILSVGFDRAWATVDQALQRAELEVTEVDRDRGIYRAVLRVAQEKGFLARILPGGGKRGEGQTVTIHLRDAGDGVVIDVQDDQGEPVSRELAEEVLLTLREFAA